MAKRKHGSPLRGLAAFTGGAIAAAIATRLMPPLIARAAGAAQTAAGREPLASLIQDHRKIMAMLDDLERTPENAVFRRTQGLLRLKRKLTTHALAEEDVIYPMLHERVHEEHDARRLYAEHAEIKMHLYALEQMPKDSSQWLARVSELKSLIQEHVRQEEEVDFPKIRDVLNRQTARHLSSTVWREKALVL